MTFVDNALEIRKNSLYSRFKEFKHFTNITEEDIERIKKLVERKGHKRDDANKFVFLKQGFVDYDHVLAYLTNNRIHIELKSYDEKILFLILALDPELKMLELYQGTNLQIKNQDLRKTKFSKLVGMIRDIFGFFDNNLLNYEMQFQNDYLCKGKLIPKYNKECKEDFISKYMNVSFDNVTEEQINRINECMEYWEVNASNPKDINTLIYNMEVGRLNVHTPEEKMILFIKIFDPELTLLRIYEEESKKENIIIRSNIEFGFYNETLINLEKKYQKKFLPDKKISDWTM